jgi:hypothetical protein
VTTEARARAARSAHCLLAALIQPIINADSTQ